MLNIVALCFTPALDSDDPEPPPPEVVADELPLFAWPAVFVQVPLQPILKAKTPCSIAAPV
jgi:hypothetical protein